MNDQTTKHDAERAEVARQLRYWHDITLRCDTNPQCTIHEHNELRVIVNALRTRYSAITNGKAWTPPPRHDQTAHICSALSVTALALFLAITQIPAGCAITGHTSEGFPVASCADGTTRYADMDGAGGYNSGVPYVIPGTWVELS